MLGIGIRTLAPYAPDKLTYARVATNDGSIALFRQSLASSRACLCETGFHVAFEPRVDEKSKSKSTRPQPLWGQSHQRERR